MPMKGLRRNDDAMEYRGWYHKKIQIIHYSLLNFPLKPLPLLPVIKKRINNFYLKKSIRENEQLRIDGDFYPCAI